MALNHAGSRKRFPEILLVTLRAKKRPQKCLASNVKVKIELNYIEIGLKLRSEQLKSLKSLSKGPETSTKAQNSKKISEKRKFDQNSSRNSQFSQLLRFLKQSAPKVVQSTASPALVTVHRSVFVHFNDMQKLHTEPKRRRKCPTPPPHHIPYDLCSTLTHTLCVVLSAPKAGDGSWLEQMDFNANYKFFPFSIIKLFNSKLFFCLLLVCFAFVVRGGGRGRIRICAEPERRFSLFQGVLRGKGL